MAWTSPGSGRVAHHTSVTRGRRARTALATSSYVAASPLWGGGGGGRAGGVVVPHPVPPVHPHGVGPAGGRLPLEEGEAAERADVPACGGVAPYLHPALPGRPPQRRAHLLLPHGCQVPAPCVEAGCAAGVRPGATSTARLGPQWPPGSRTRGRREVVVWPGQCLAGGGDHAIDQEIFCHPKNRGVASQLLVCATAGAGT